MDTQVLWEERKWKMSRTYTEEEVTYMVERAFIKGGWDTLEHFLETGDSKPPILFYRARKRNGWVADLFENPMLDGPKVSAKLVLMGTQTS